jgi:hypothetical protein
MRQSRTSPPIFFSQVQASDQAPGASGTRAAVRQDTTVPKTSSRSAATTTEASRTSLADLTALIEGANLSATQKRDQICAVRTLARLLGAEPQEIVAEPSRLRRRMEAIAPEAVGLSKGRWANIRSLVGKALGLARPMQPGCQIAQLLPEWEKLLALLDRSRATRLLALAHQLSIKGVGPADVSLQDLEAYREAIYNDRLRAKPEKTWDSIVWTWNACWREVEYWPDIEIPREIRREVYVLPWSDFPASLKMDVDAFLLRLSGLDLSEDDPNRPTRPATLKTREYQLRVAASARVHKGVDPQSIRSVVDLVTLENFKLVLRFLLDRHDGKTSPQVSQMAGRRTISPFLLRGGRGTATNGCSIFRIQSS